MTVIQYSRLSDVTAFTRTFIPGGTVFPTPRYVFSQDADGISYTHVQRLGSTGYFNIDPTVTFSGPNLSIDGNGRLSGLIDRMVFSSDNRGTIATLEGLSAQGAEFTAVLFARLQGDRLSNSNFDAFIGRAVGSLSFSSENDQVRVTGFLKHVTSLDLGAGDDIVSASRPTSTALSIEGGDGFDILRLSDFGRPNLFVVNLATGQVITEDGSFSFSGFERIDGNAFVQEYIGSDGNDAIFAAGRDDLMAGGAGADTLDGGFGNDSITGGFGNDSIAGGSGNICAGRRRGFRHD